MSVSKFLTSETVNKAHFVVRKHVLFTVTIAFLGNDHWLARSGNTHHLLRFAKCHSFSLFSMSKGAILCCYYTDCFQCNIPFFITENCCVCIYYTIGFRSSALAPLFNISSTSTVFKEVSNIKENLLNRRNIHCEMSHMSPVIRYI